MQIIVAAMGFGCLSFMIVAVFASQNPAQAAGAPILDYIALLLCGTMICVRVVVPFVMAQMPTTNRAMYWVENQLKLLDEQA